MLSRREFIAATVTLMAAAIAWDATANGGRPGPHDDSRESGGKEPP